VKILTRKHVEEYVFLIALYLLVQIVYYSE
jgi:hypothetical protein